MILTRSPYYLRVPFPNDFVTSVTYTIDINTGTPTVKTTEQSYTVTKQRPSDDFDSLWLDVSPFVRDVFEYSPIYTPDYPAVSVPLYFTNSIFLVDVNANINDSLGSDLTNVVFNKVATDGYGYFQEGQNYEPTKRILLSHDNYKADANGYFIVPLRMEQGLGNISVNSVVVPHVATDQHNNNVVNLVIPLNLYTDNVQVEFEGESINIELIEECKYPVQEIQFINRFGVPEIIHFYKTKKDSLKIEGKEFHNAYTDGLTYNTERHQIKQYNKVVNKSFKIETGYLNEDYNATLQELLASEYVWIREDNNLVPINIKTNSLEFKTGIVDKLISYSIEFDYAFDLINNV